MSNRGCQKRKAEGSGSIEDDCNNQSAKKTKSVCLFCLSSTHDDLQLGEFLGKEDLTCHYFCLLLASGLFQNGRPNDKSSIRGFMLSDIRNELRRGLRLKCYYCHEKGATIGCCQKKCRKAFHLPCGRSNGSLHQFFDGFGSYCDEHCPRQSMKTSDHCRNREVSCSICLSPLNASLSSVDVLHSPCCNNSWFHRLCLQQYAISAGKHHFRCPLCNCHKKFFEEMETFGIYIPDQDASWERQSGAFDELLERHSTCDADTCSCPLGRNHDAQSGKYDLLLCSCCGSFGSHRTCRGLVWYESSLMCPFCAGIAKEYQEQKAKTPFESRRSITSDSGSSSHRTSNVQFETRSPLISSTQTCEKVIHIEMEDFGDDVDIENDSDIHPNGVHIPPFFSNHCNAKSLEKAKSLPFCSVFLYRIDKIIPLPEGLINLKKLKGFSLNKRTGHFIRIKLKSKQSKTVNSHVKVSEEEQKGKESIVSVPEQHCNKQDGKKEREDKRPCHRPRQTWIKKSKKKDAQCLKIQKKENLEGIGLLVKSSKHMKENGRKTVRKEHRFAKPKRCAGRLNKQLKESDIATPKKTANKKTKRHPSPSTSAKKRFLIKFNHVQTQGHNRRSKIHLSNKLRPKTSPILSSEKRYVQSTLNFSKESPSVEKKSFDESKSDRTNVSGYLLGPTEEKTKGKVFDNKVTDSGKKSRPLTQIVVHREDGKCEEIQRLGENKELVIKISDPLMEVKPKPLDEMDTDQSLAQCQNDGNENNVANVLTDSTNSQSQKLLLFTHLKELRFLCREFFN